MRVVRYALLSAQPRVFPKSGFLAPVFLAFLISVLVSGAASAVSPDKAFHQYVMDAWSIEEGLAQITATALVQGPEDRIWIGTQAGLSRFDGVKFTNYDPENTPELPGSLLQALYVDSRDRLWIGTYKGAALYDDRSFHSIQAPGGAGASVNVFDFVEDAAGRVFAATDAGLLRAEDGRLQPVTGQTDSGLRSATIHDGDLWLGSRGRVYEQTAGEWRTHELPEGMATAWVTGFERYQGTLWAATDKGLVRFTAGRWQSTGLDSALDQGVIEALYVDGDDNLWVSSASSLVRIHDGQVRERIPDEASYAHGGVLSITEDHEGNLWLGSRWHGVARLWDGWVFRYSEVEGLHNPLVWSVARGPEGDLWVGTMDGLSRFRDGRFELILPGTELPHPHAYTLLPEASRIWVGTRAGLVWWDRDAGRTATPAAFSRLAGSQINGIIQRQDGSYWLATSAGVWQWDGEELHHSMTEVGVRVLLETRDGTLFAGSQTGLFRQNDRGAFERVAGIPDEADITALNQLSDGRIVAGSLGESLFLETDSGWVRFDKSDGIPANSAFAIEDHEGVLWVGGIRGIYRLPLSSIDEYREGRIDRLPGRMILHERGDISGAQKGYCCNGAGNAKGFMEDGEFWLPSRGGIVHIIPDQIRFNREPPEVMIERYRVDGEWHSLQAEESVRLSPDQRDIAFDFTALSYQDPGSVQLEYRLLGYSEQWQPIDDIERRTAFFTNLPSGEFRLQVRGSNNAGVWSDEVAQLDVDIKPHIHETLWFKLMAGLGLIFLIWAGYRFQLRTLRAQRERLEHKVIERTEELRVANEHLLEYSERLEEVSNTDPLTGLWNRRYLVEQLPKDLAHFHREMCKDGNEDHVMVFGLIDLDHFKRINDSHGHGVGDRILEQFAELLKREVREGDYVVRWGGEEFLIVFRPMPRQQPARIAERIRVAVASERFESRADGAGVRTLTMTCSIGFAEYPAFRESPEALDWEEIVELADQALYFVKERGRNGWCIFRPTDAIRPGTLRAELEKGMDQLVESGHIKVMSSCKDGNGWGGNSE